MNIKTTKPHVDWYVIFTDSDHDHWLFKYLRTGFKHVYAIQKSEGGQFWLKVDSRYAYLDISLNYTDKYPTARAFAGDDAVILPIHANIPSVERTSMCQFTCVEVTKALLGIKSWWVLTPWQLYKYLKGLQDEQLNRSGKKGSQAEQKGTRG